MDEQITINERRKYLRKMQARYRKGDKREKGELLDEMVAVTELHRKSLLRLMNGNLARQKRTGQRGKSYGAEVEDALRVIAESTDYICAERMVGSLEWLAEQLSMHGELVLTAELRTQLRTISVSSVQRILRRIRQDERRLPRPGPSENNRVRQEIPMKRIRGDEAEPGHFEVDLVHHCGPSAAGQYVHTLQMFDVRTGWSERVAVLGRSYRVMENGLERILARLPFAVKELHPDNGSEFLNHHLVRYWRDKVKGVELSRSRPYQKNDNRFVEQKNRTLVRAYLGDIRLDSVAQTNLLNQLYEQMWLYYNCFQPVMRLAKKVQTVDDQQRIRIQRIYDRAQTPCQRLCHSGGLDDHERQRLETRIANTNPRHLRNAIYAQLDQLFALPCAAPDHTEDIHLTLYPLDDGPSTGG